MSNDNVKQMKGFRQQPKPTKGQVLKENQTLGDSLQQRLSGMQQFFGNILQQLMNQGKAHDQELQTIAVWLATDPTSEPAKKGDALLMDYAGVLLNDDGSVATLELKAADGSSAQVPDYFDGGSGSMFILTSLGGGTLIAGFESQLEGMKAGEGKEIEVQFPAEYGVKSLQNRKARFTVYIHEVRASKPQSSVGKLIEENRRIRREAQAVLAAEAAKARAAAAALTKEAAIDEEGLPVEVTLDAERNVVDIQEVTPEAPKAQE